MLMKRNKYGQFAYVCYDDPNSEDKKIGFKNATEAQKSLDKLKVGTKIDV